VGKGGAGFHFTSPVFFLGGGGRKGRKGRKEGGELKVIPGLSGLQGKAKPFTLGKTGLPIILCLGKTTLSQDQYPEIQF
jgi:hypothetical protein